MEFSTLEPTDETVVEAAQVTCISVGNMLSAYPSHCQSQDNKDVHSERSHDEIMSRGGGISDVEKNKINGRKSCFSKFRIDAGKRVMWKGEKEMRVNAVDCWRCLIKRPAD